MSPRKPKQKRPPEVEFSFDGLMSSLKDAVAYVEGEEIAVRITKFNPDRFAAVIKVDRDFVKLFRAKHKLSQQELADLFSVRLDTVKSWESKQRDRAVSGAARRLFQVFATQPALVENFKEKKGA
ncbi:MAG: helix-turn-helix domain-containing protein [Proteobacteria bacterium]|nr:helix-turn-helix domain-containing protein [Pseudomonadota bacterium]